MAADFSADTPHLQDPTGLLRGNTLIFFRWRNSEGWPVEYVTSTVQGLLGYQAEDFMSGKLIYAQLVHPDDLSRVIQEVTENSVPGVGRFDHAPYRVLHADGSYVWVDDRTAILRNSQGAITHYFGYLSYRGKP